MARRRYLVAYDIANVGRLRRVHRVMKAFGLPMQYSVFLCDLDGVELVRLRSKLADEVKQSEDTVAFVDLGDPTTSAGRFEFLGLAPPLPTRGATIV